MPLPNNQEIEPVETVFHGPQNQCFGCGQRNPVGLRLEFEAIRAPGPSERRAEVVCSTAISDQYEGPPGYLHGGIIATLLDEAMSKANRAEGVTAMTRQMTVEYLRPVPSGSPIRIEGRVVRSDGRKHWMEGRIVNSEDKVLASATGLFIAIAVAKAGGE